MKSAIGAYCGVILVTLFLMTVWIVVFYAEPGFPWHSYITLILGYFAAFSILLLVPIDIAMIVYDRRSTNVSNDPDYDYDTFTLGVLYNIFFTIVLIMGSFVLGFEEYYNTDGYFTFLGKMLSSFKRMMFDTIVPLIAGVIVLGILIAKKIVTSNATALQLAAVIVTNTMYEIGLMFLLGYALVEVPRSCWQEADVDGSLLRIQMKAASQFKDISEAQLSVSLAVSDVLKTKQQLASYADPQLQEAMDILVSECPTEFRSDRMGKVAANKSGQITIDTLASLRTRLNTLKDLYKMAQAKVEGTKLQAYRLEDICAAKAANANVIHWSMTDKDSTPSEFKWELVYRPLLYRLAAVLTAVLSILSLLGVICSMHGVSNNVSVYFLAVHNDSSSTGGIVLFILLTLGYTTYLTTWALFQMKVSAANELVPGRTTPEALSFNVRMVARLAAPLAFFYLGWISENGMKSGDWQYNDAPDTYVTQLQNVTDPFTGIPTLQNVTVAVNDGISMPSAFSKFYQLSNTGPFQQVFGTICPIILYIVMFLFIINAFNRLLVLVKMDNYQFGAPIVTDEQLREGKRQLQRHKKTTERKFRRGELKNYLLTVGGGQENGDSIFSRIFFFLKPSGDANKDGARDTLTSEAGMDAPVLKEPQPLGGMVEKKGGFTITGSGYKEFYAEVRSPGYLHFYKDKRACDMNRHNDPSRSNDPNVLILDLKTVLDFKLPEHRNKNRDNLELDMDMGDETIKLKFKNPADPDSWRKTLQEWKDFHIDSSHLYGGSTSGGSYNAKAISDVESGHMATNPLGSPVSNSRGTKDELDSIQVDDDNDDDDKGGKKSSSAAGGWFGGGKKGTSAPSAMSAPAHDDKPQLIEGWLEKKGHGKMGMGGDWQKRYLRIDEKQSVLVYSKSSDPREKPAGTIDLRMVKDITPYEKSGAPDYTRFNIDVGDKVYKFKAANDKEGQNWIDTLNAWRDHFLLNMA